MVVLPAFEAFPQYNCCFHKLDFAVVDISFAVLKSFFVQLPELTNAGCKMSVVVVVVVTVGVVEAAEAVF